MENIVKWFFTARADYPAPDNVFNYTPWLVVIVGFGLIWLYYWWEGRRKAPFIKDNAVLKQLVLDPMLSAPQVPIWAFVGLILLGAQYLDTSFFSWRIWLDIWIVWGALIAAYWLRFFVVEYPRHMVNYERFQERAKYLPGVHRTRRSVARR